MNDTLDFDDSPPQDDKKTETSEKAIDLFGEIDDQLNNFFVSDKKDSKEKSDDRSLLNSDQTNTVSDGPEDLMDKFKDSLNDFLGPNDTTAEPPFAASSPIDKAKPGQPSSDPVLVFEDSGNKTQSDAPVSPDSDFNDRSATSKPKWGAASKTEKIQAPKRTTLSIAKVQPHAVDNVASDSSKIGPLTMESSQPPRTAVSAKSAGVVPSQTIAPRAEKPVKKTEKKAALKPGLKATPPVVQTPQTKKRIQAESKSAKPVKGLKKPVKPQGSKKFRLLKYALAGIVLVVAVLALIGALLTPESTPPVQVAATSKTHKIIKPPVKPPEPKPAPPSASPLPQQPDPPAVPAGASPTGEPVAPEKTITPTVTLNPIDEIQAFLLQWKTAWEKGAGEKEAMDILMTFYSEDFISNGVDKKRFCQELAEKNRNKSWIRVQLDKIHINGPLENGCYTARFNQIDQSPNDSDISEQFLVLKKEPPGWKIIGLNPQITGLFPFSIHADSYRSIASAQAAIEGYRQRGLQAYWTEVIFTEKGTWYRVYIGFFGNQKAAEEFIAAEALKGAMPINTRYANLVGVFDSEEELELQQSLVIKNGYIPYVVDSNIGRRLLYVGAYINLVNAEKFAAELKSKGILTKVVKR